MKGRHEDMKKGDIYDQVIISSQSLWRYKKKKKKNLQMNQGSKCEIQNFEASGRKQKN